VEMTNDRPSLKRSCGPAGECHMTKEIRIPNVEIRPAETTQECGERISEFGIWELYPLPSAAPNSGFGFPSDFGFRFSGFFRHSTFVICSRHLRLRAGPKKYPPRTRAPVTRRAPPVGCPGLPSSNKAV